MVSIKKVLITGANGFIGNKLLTAYQEQGIEAIGVDLKGNGRDIIEGNIGKPEAWGSILEGVDVVIHTAALVSNAMEDHDMWRVNVLSTRNLINEAARHGVKRFVQLSSIVAYGNVATGELDEDYPVHAHGGSYVLTKLASEHTVLAAHARGDIEVVIVRPGDVYGPGCRVWVNIPIEMIKSKQFLLPAMGKGCFRPVYIDDLVRGICLAAASNTAAGQIFNLASNGYITTKAFFKYHHQWLKKLGPLCLPSNIAYAIAESTYQTKLLFGVRSEGSGASTKQLTSKAWFSIAKAERLLGWKPEISLEEGMKRTEAWARSTGLI